MSLFFRIVVFSIIINCSLSNLDEATEEENKDIIVNISDYLKKQNETKGGVYHYLYADILDYQRIPLPDTSKRYEQLSALLDLYDHISPGWQQDTEFEELKSKIEGVRRSLFIEVSHVVNFVWIGGLSETQLEYFKVWKEEHANTDYKMRIWRDSTAYLANFLFKRIKMGMEKYAKESGTVTCVANREVVVTIGLQDQIYDTIDAQMDSEKSFDEAARTAMRKYDLASNVEIESTLRAYEESWKPVPGIGFEVREISDLWDENDIMRRYYFRELGLRQILAAASDIVRARILKKYGGVYADVDVLPSMKTDKIEGLNKMSGYRLYNTEFAEQPQKLKNIIEAEVTRFITKKLMDRRIPVPDSVIDLDYLQQWDASNLFNWDFLDKLMNAETGSIVDWSNPLSHVRVPPGPEAAMGRWLGDKISNMFMAASNCKDRENPGMQKLEAVIQENYARIDDEFVRLPHGVWPGWPINETKLNVAQAYRLDGIVPGSMATVDITGPGAVMEALYESSKKIGKLTQRKKDDLELGHEYFNAFTDEDESTWLVQLMEDKNFLTEKSKMFYFILQVGKDKSVTFASKSLYAKSLWKGRGVHLLWNQRAKTFIELLETSNFGVPVEIDSETFIKVVVVGHGDGDGGIVGISPQDLAEGLKNAIVRKTSQERSQLRPTLKKVSFVASQRDLPVLDGPLPDGFVKSFLMNIEEALDPKQTIVTLRNSDVQTNVLGKKFSRNPKARLQMSGISDSLCSLGDQWVRCQTKEGTFLFKTGVYWNQKAKSWWASPVQIDHKDFLKLDKVLDRSGPLHNSIVGMEREV